MNVDKLNKKIVQIAKLAIESVGHAKNFSLENKAEELSEDTLLKIKNFELYIDVVKTHISKTEQVVKDFKDGKLAKKLEKQTPSS